MTKEFNQSSKFKSDSIDGKMFGTEERFRNTNKSQTDNLYSLPKINDAKSIIFPSASRDFTVGASRINVSNTGPGSYDVSKGYDWNSEYPKKTGSRFATCPRESMAMKTPSPGAIYQIDNTYWNGPVKKLAIGFNTDERFADTKGSASTADLYIPKYDTGRAITIGQKLKMYNPGSLTPGPIYDSHLRKEYPTPAFSFGKEYRFKQVGMLPERESD